MWTIYIQIHIKQCIDTCTEGFGAALIFWEASPAWLCSLRLYVIYASEWWLWQVLVLRNEYSYALTNSIHDFSRKGFVAREEITAAR